MFLMLGRRLRDHQHRVLLIFLELQFASQHDLDLVVLS